MFSFPGQGKEYWKEKDEGNAEKREERIEDEVHKVAGGGINFEYLVTIEAWDCLRENTYPFSRLTGGWVERPLDWGLGALCFII